MTYADFENLGQALGYIFDPRGACRGHSCLFAQYILANDTEGFRNRLNLIEKEIYKDSDKIIMEDDDTNLEKFNDAINKQLKINIENLKNTIDKIKIKGRIDPGHLTQDEKKLIFTDEEKELLQILSFYEAIYIYINHQKNSEAFLAINL